MPRQRCIPESNSSQEKRGLVCGRCGCQHLRVVYLKPLPNGMVLRRRECRQCRRRFSTRETAL
jgi:transcriptional regulator NrdR family protein